MAKAARYTDLGDTPPTIVEKIDLSDGIVEFAVRSPLIAQAAQAGQFVRVLAWAKGELIPLTLADWDAKNGTVTLVVQAMGTSSISINRMNVGDAFAGIAGPFGRPSELHRYGGGQDRRVHGRRRRPSAGLSDHARASAARQSCDADLGLPLQGPDVLDGRGRARRPAARRNSAINST